MTGGRGDIRVPDLIPVARDNVAEDDPPRLLAETVWTVGRIAGASAALRRSAGDVDLLCAPSHRQVAEAAW